MFSCEFCKHFKKIFFVELLRTVVSVLFYCNMNFHKCVCKNNFEYDNTFEEVKKSKERIVKNWFTKRPEKNRFWGEKVTKKLPRYVILDFSNSFFTVK